MNPLDWFAGIFESFKAEFYAYLITVAVMVVIMIVIFFVSKGRFFKPLRIIKIVMNCVLGFVILFIINGIGGFFTGGAWAFTPKAWYSWVIIGLFGIIGIVFLIVSIFVWPDVFVSTSGASAG